MVCGRRSRIIGYNVMKKEKDIAQIILLLIVMISVTAYCWIPVVNSKVNYIFMLFSSMSVESIIGYIRSFGAYAAVISFFLMVFQSVAAPLPGFLITFANTAIFGWWKGALLSWSGAMAGAFLCFMIARIAGRDLVEKLTVKLAMGSINVYFEKYGKYTVLICRLIPFISFDFVSYAAGLTAMGIVPFFIATGIGQLPTILVYSYVGGILTGRVEKVVTAILLSFAFSTFIFSIKNIYTENQHKEL